MSLKMPAPLARRSLAALAVSALFACSATAPAPDAASPVPLQARGERCLRVSDIQNWRVIDNRQLLVFGRRSGEVWHLKLFSSCMDLGISETVAFRARGSNLLCGDPGDELITRNGRCPVASMRRVGPAEVAELTDKRVRKDIGKLPPREAPAAPPKPPEEK
jgi:Family of unknown function (DUF6491)